MRSEDLAERAKNLLAHPKRTVNTRAAMRPQTKILAGAGIAVVITLAVWFATYRRMPSEPVYKGRPLSQWLDGTALAKGASSDEVNRTLNRLDSNAVPWLTWLLQENSRGSVDRPLFRAELQLLRYDSSLAKKGLEKLGQKDARRSSALTLLSLYAPGTVFEENVVRAILKSKSPLADFDHDKIVALGAFTRRPDLVLPTLCAGLTDRLTRDISVMMLSRFGSAAVSNVYQMALTEPGTNGPAASALLRLDRTEWARFVEEKQREQ